MQCHAKRKSKTKLWCILFQFWNKGVRFMLSKCNFKQTYERRLWFSRAELILCNPLVAIAIANLLGYVSIIFSRLKTDFCSWICYIQSHRMENICGQQFLRLEPDSPLEGQPFLHFQMFYSLLQVFLNCCPLSGPILHPINSD